MDYQNQRERKAKLNILVHLNFESGAKNHMNGETARKLITLVSVPAPRSEAAHSCHKTFFQTFLCECRVGYLSSINLDQKFQRVVMVWMAQRKHLSRHFSHLLSVCTQARRNDF